MSEYHKASKVFTAHQFENEEYGHLLLDLWYEKHEVVLNGRNIRITVEIEPSAEDVKRDILNDDFDDDFS